MEKQEAQDAGEDYERKQFWKYSAESAAAWEKKMAKKAKMANNGFTGKNQQKKPLHLQILSYKKKLIFFSFDNRPFTSCT